MLKDIITVELFFLNAKSAVYNVSVFLLVFEAMKNDAASCFCSPQLPDDSLSLDPLQLSKQWLQGTVSLLCRLECKVDSLRK